MTPDALIIILFRWIHITTACIAVGGVFFMRIILPIGLKTLDPEAGKTMFLKSRRAFKMVIHTSILLFLLSGSYNFYCNRLEYKAMGSGLGHSLFGMHALLAIVIFTIALWLLAGKEPPATHRKWMMVNLVLLLTTIAVASTLKYAREHAKPAATTTVSQ